MEHKNKALFSNYEAQLEVFDGITCELRIVLTLIFEQLQMLGAWILLDKWQTMQILIICCPLILSGLDPHCCPRLICPNTLSNCRDVSFVSTVLDTNKLYAVNYRSIISILICTVTMYSLVDVCYAARVSLWRF